MYNKPAIAPADRDAIFNPIDELVMGTLVTPHDGGIAITHLTFLAERHRGVHGTFTSHLARANEHAALVEAGRPSEVIFGGPDAYISTSC
jgi:transcriptional regulator